MGVTGAFEAIRPSKFEGKLARRRGPSDSGGCGEAFQAGFAVPRQAPFTGARDAIRQDIAAAFAFDRSHT